jgi:hypothetical protein
MTESHDKPNAVELPDARTMLEVLVGLKQLKRKIEDGTATPQEDAAYHLTKEGAWEMAEQVRAVRSAERAPVAWRHRSMVNGEWTEWRHQESKPRGPAGETFEFQPLFSAPSATEPRIAALWHFATCPFDHCQRCVDDEKIIKGIRDEMDRTEGRSA